MQNFSWLLQSFLPSSAENGKEYGQKQAASCPRGNEIAPESPKKEADCI